MTLREVFHSPPGTNRDYWIYLSDNHQEWTLDTGVYFPSHDPVTGEPLITPDSARRGYVSTLNTDDVQDIVYIADSLAGHPDDAVRLEAFTYYYRYNAYLPSIGAPPPPPIEEIHRQCDREFYDKLGGEDPARPCKSSGCLRGSVRFAILCRVHHFESITHRPCPFND